MTQTPVTTEQALERLRVAMEKGDSAEVAKWDSCIKGNNDLRIRAKQQRRQMHEASLHRQLKRSYNLPT